MGEPCMSYKTMCANPACFAAKTKAFHEAIDCIPQQLQNYMPVILELQYCGMKHVCDDDVSITAVMAMASPLVMDAIFQASPDSSNGNFMTILGGVAGAMAGAALTTIVVRRRSVRQPALLA